MQSIASNDKKPFVIRSVDLEWLKSEYPYNYRRFCQMQEAGTAGISEFAFERYKSWKKVDVPIPQYERGG